MSNQWNTLSISNVCEELHKPLEEMPEKEDLTDELPDDLKRRIRRVFCWSVTALLIVLSAGVITHSVNHSSPGTEVINIVWSK